MMKVNTYLIPLVLVFLVPFTTKGQSPQKHIGQEKLYYGVAYYPEVWDFETVDEDIMLMQQAGINVVRMGEFSWNLMEPEEGVFRFQWMLDLIDWFYRAGIDVIIGTPTATPPAWLAAAHPEIFRKTAEGRRLGHGSRRNTSYTSEVYRSYARRICSELAKAIGDHPGIIAWQIDNEFHVSPDYSKETKEKWHRWLMDRYGDIEQLNTIWRTNLWSQEYGSFDQVPTDDGTVWHHPSLRMDWLKFSSDQVVEFQDIQVRAIREYSAIPITHDGMPGQDLEYPELFSNLDFMATNFYHNFSVYGRVLGNFDRMRGYGKGMHWVFETAPNYSGGGKQGKNWFIHQPEGAMRAILWANYASGGQGTMFWLWRQHPAGQEMPHGAFLSAWGKPMANYDALAGLGNELGRMSGLMMNAPVEPARIAIFYSHTADRGYSIEQNSGEDIRYYTDWTGRFYTPLSDAFLHRDVIHEGADISHYSLLVVPMMPVIPEKLQERLKVWVEKGGTLILGPMSGFRSEYWTAFTNHAMGTFGQWTGIDVDTRIPVDPYNDRFGMGVRVRLNGSDSAYRAGLWSEALSSREGTPVATYVSGMHHGKTAIMEHSVGKGKVVVLGCDPGYDIMKTLYLSYARQAGISPLASGDPDVLVVNRVSVKQTWQVIVNLSHMERTIEPSFSLGKDLLTGKSIPRGKLSLEPFTVIIAEITD